MERTYDLIARVPKGTKVRLRQLALQEGSTIESLIKDAIETFVEQNLRVADSPAVTRGREGRELG
jgi:predicted DNA-binding protein